MRAVIVGTLLVAVAASAAPAQVVVRQGPGGARTVRMGIGVMSGPFTIAPAAYRVGGWRVGQWARYAITQSIGPMPLTQIRTVSIVGQRGEQYWVEVQEEMTGLGGGGGGAVRKMLIAFGSVRARTGTETYVMGPDSSVVRQTLLRAGSGGDDDFTFPQGWQRVGEESVQVTAGTFRAVHWRKGNEHLWTGAEAVPVGIVKYESEGTSVELGSRGTDARSRIPYGG